MEHSRPAEIGKGCEKGYLQSCLGFNGKKQVRTMGGMCFSSCLL